MSSPSPNTDPAFYLAGPTGSGKSAIALALAERIGQRAAIVNADAFQLYRGYEILSAAPSAEDRLRIPHRLYGELALTENCDAARFAKFARETIDQLAADGILPIVVGGSGLYLKSLTHGLAPTPPGDPALREKLDALSLDELVAWYEREDPNGAAATNLRNRRYVTRNLEITLLSGQPASVLKKEFAESAPSIRGVVIERDREDLYDRINRRTPAMFAEGVVDEIRALADIDISVTAEKAIGLSEIRAVIAGKLSEPEAIEQIQQATRRYAKRQGTWFRRETVFQTVCLLPTETPDSAADRILNLFPHLGQPSDF
ncbi:MAG: tRNA (adenosine(37)-N6)-dimethylallyltransferase MiaA, partial [Verrucomicrobiae bacterium]|nr:tRNA (adenosine(37)-N6)-dimethylallyltransferase MiaA [Verrucomicrobiae bacterium]